MGFGIKKRIKRLLGIDAGKNSTKVNQRPVKYQIWSIGIFEGNGPYNLTACNGAVSPILTGENVTDVDALFVADPFMIQQGGVWHMFFEVLNKATNLGEIGHAISRDGLTWAYQRIVLREPFHISYPYVFEWENEFYMLPECWRGGGVRLYKAASFPNSWTYIGTLLEGGRFADSSIFRHEDSWWLFSETGEKVQSPKLRLFMSDSLLGSWQEHPMSPIVDMNPHIARPGGRVITVGDNLVRFAQDVYPVYGTQVYAFEIQELTTLTYKECRVKTEPILMAGSYDWNSGGMHHLDAHYMNNGRWLACVDGFSWRDHKGHRVD